MRRLRKISKGDSKAQKTPEEKLLLKKNLIKESMLILQDERGTYTTELRGLTLTEQGEKVLTQNEERRKETIRFWVGTILTVVGIIVPIILSL